MILTLTIITFLSTILMLSFGQTIKACWEALNEEQKAEIVESVSKKEVKLKNQLRSEPPDDCDGDSTEVSNLCRRTTLYFNNRRVCDK